MKYMSDIVFRNTSYAFFTEIKHGQIRLKGKLDSGAPISVFNLSALSLYLGADESVLRQQNGGNIELTVKSMEFQKKRMLEAFHATTSDHILVIDELKEQ